MGSSAGIRARRVTGWKLTQLKQGLPNSPASGELVKSSISLFRTRSRAHSPAKLPAPASAAGRVDGHRPRGRDATPEPRALGLVRRMELSAKDSERE